MGKVLGKIALVAVAVGVNFIPGVGQAISGALVSTLGGTFAALGAVTTGLAIADAVLVAGALGAAGGLLGKGGTIPPARLKALNIEYGP